MSLPNNPITRKETYLAKIAGQNVTIPDEPITREEMYLDAIAKGGGSGDGDMKKSVYDSDLDVATAGGIKAFVSGAMADKADKPTSPTNGNLASLDSNGDLADSGISKDVVPSGTTTSNKLVNASQLTATQTLIDDTVGWESYNEFDFSKNTSVQVTESNGKIVNVITDTLSQLDFAIQGRKNGSFVKYYVNSVSGHEYITTTGKYSFSFTIEESDDVNQLYIGHKGSTNNIMIIIPFTKKGNFTFIADFEGINPSTASGIVLDEVVLCKSIYKDLPYVPYHASVEDCKADNSVIAPVENGTTTSQAYAVGSHAIRNGAFITWKNAKAQGESISDSDYDSGDVASELFIKGTILTSSDNLNNITDDGLYIIGDTLPTNAPSGATHSNLIVCNKMGERKTQLVIRGRGDSATLYMRVYTDSWQSWFKFDGTILS